MLKGHRYIQKTREYLDYLEKHFNNIEPALWEVTKACKSLPTISDSTSYLQLHDDVVKHDLSKFSAEEFTQYRSKWSPVPKELAYSYMVNLNFDKAWEHHYTNNTHHTQSIRTNEYQVDLIHCVIDWTAMSYTFGGTAESYYEDNKHKMNLSQQYTDFLNIIFAHLRTNK